MRPILTRVLCRELLGGMVDVQRIRPRPQGQRGALPSLRPFDPGGPADLLLPQRRACDGRRREGPWVTLPAAHRERDAYQLLLELFVGGACRDRTGDLRNAIAALSQLS